MEIRRGILGLALLLSVTLAVAQPPKTPRRETQIAGKTIAAWTAELEGGKAVPAALRALAQAGPEAKPAIPALVRLLEGEPMFTQVIVVLTLAKIGPDAVPALRKALESRTPNTRVLAARALGLIGDATALTNLMAALSDREPSVRRVAATALGQLNNKGATGTLKKALDDPDEETRIEAAAALWNLASDTAALAPLRKALGSKDEPLRLRVLQVLAEIGPRGREALDEVSPLFKDESLAVRLQAAQAFFRLGGAAEKALPTITAALKNKEDRLDAVAALTTLASDQTASMQLAMLANDADVAIRREIASVGLAEKGLEDTDVAVRWWSALHALGRKPSAARLDELVLLLREGLLADEKKQPYADVILSVRQPDRAATLLGGLLRDGSVRVRLEAAQLLAMPGLDARLAMDALVAALASEDKLLRRAAADALGTVGSEMIPRLRNLLDDADARVRESAARAIAGIGVPARSLAGKLLERMREGESAVRIQAALAYWRVEGISETPLALLDNLIKDVDISERWEAVEAIGLIASEARPAIKGLTEVLVNLLKDRDARVRAMAARWLWRRVRQSKPVVPLMRDVLGGRDALARRIALETLGELDEDARPAPLLVAALDERDATLRLTAIEALARLGDTEALLKALSGNKRVAEGARLAFARLGKGKQAGEYLAAREAKDEAAQKRLAAILHPDMP
jgi:HEAT repeat protein